MTLKTFLAAAAVVVGATAAHAAPISITSFDAADYDSIVAGFTSGVTEDFEGFTEMNVADGFATNVGTFSTTGGTGFGNTVTDTVAQGNFAGNMGNMLAIRDGNVHGRESTTQFLAGGTSADDKFLDSNDTFGILWTATNGTSLFNKLVLTVTDAADTGATLTVTSGTDTSAFSLQGNGNKKTVVIYFDTAVATANILFENSAGGNQKLNDGFSIDDLTVGTVPLPASALFLLAGLGGLGAMKRRRKAA